MNISIHEIICMYCMHVIENMYKCMHYKDICSSNS